MFGWFKRKEMPIETRLKKLYSDKVPYKVSDMEYAGYRLQICHVFEDGTEIQYDYNRVRHLLKINQVSYKKTIVYFGRYLSGYTIKLGASPDDVCSRIAAYRAKARREEARVSRLKQEFYSEGKIDVD